MHRRFSVAAVVALLIGPSAHPAAAQQLTNESFQVQYRRVRHPQPEAHERPVRHGLHRRERLARAPRRSLSSNAKRRLA